jgi:hypothetical protein
MHARPTCLQHKLDAERDSARTSNLEIWEEFETRIPCDLDPLTTPDISNTFHRHRAGIAAPPLVGNTFNLEITNEPDGEVLTRAERADTSPPKESLEHGASSHNFDFVTKLDSTIRRVFERNPPETCGSGASTKKTRRITGRQHAKATHNDSNGASGNGGRRQDTRDAEPDTTWCDPGSSRSQGSARRSGSNTPCLQPRADQSGTPDPNARCAGWSR